MTIEFTLKNWHVDNLELLVGETNPKSIECDAVKFI